MRDLHDVHAGIVRAALKSAWRGIVFSYRGDEPGLGRLGCKTPWFYGQCSCSSRITGLEVIDIDDGLGKFLGGFLWQVVSDLENPVIVFSYEVVSVRRAIPGRCERVVLPVDGYRGHRDDRP